MYCIFLLLAFVSQADAAGLRGARKQIEEVVALEDADAQVSLVQVEATMHEKVTSVQGQSNAASTFHHAVQDVIDSFGARVAGDVSGDVQGLAVQNGQHEASDTSEAAANLALLREIETLKAEGLDLQERLVLLEEDHLELEKGLAELMKNVSMAKEFAGTAKSGLFNAPKPQLQLGSFDDLDQDEAAFEEKHKPHASHVEELAASTLNTDDPTLVAAVLHSVETAVATDKLSLPSARHAALLNAHAGLAAERDALLQQRDKLKQQLADAQIQTQPLADKVLEVTYNGVSLNMGVVGMSAPECDGKGGPGCHSKAWGR